jgi:hypothetical protein
LIFDGVIRLPRAVRLALLILTGTLFGYAILVALPHDDYIRYQSFKGTAFGRLPWIYDRIHHDAAPIDIVIFGTSRSGAGIVPPLLEAELAARCGERLKVANFALPTTGMDIRLTLLNETLATKRPRLVLFDTTERLPRDGHQAFGGLARTSELMASPWLINRKLPANLMGLPIRQVRLAVATLAPDSFGYRRQFDPTSYAGTTIRIAPAIILTGDAAAPVAASAAVHAARMAEGSAQRLASIRPPLFGGRVEAIEFRMSRHYVHAVHDRARAAGAQFAIVFFPFYRGPEQPLDKDWLETIAPVWSVPGVSTDPANYIDTAHLGRKPEAHVQNWLAERIAGMLGCAAG